MTYPQERQPRRSVTFSGKKHYTDRADLWRCFIAGKDLLEYCLPSWPQAFRSFL